MRPKPLENKEIIEELVGCRRCDALSIKPQLVAGQIAKCAQCGSTIFSRKVDSINRTLAVALAGVILFFPAILLPILAVDLVGNTNQASLITCIALMVERGSYLVATSVFIFAVAVPAVRLFSALYLTCCLKFNYIPPSLIVFFRSYHQLDSWTMLHVFFLGIIVSMYKLEQMTSMSLGIGIFALILLLLCSTLLSSTLDQDSVWEKLEHSRVS